jgi:hypothetical protein
MTKCRSAAQAAVAILVDGMAQRLGHAAIRRE